MLKTYITYNSTVRFLKCKFNIYIHTINGTINSIKNKKNKNIKGRLAIVYM